MGEAANRFLNGFRGEWLPDEPLSRHTSFKVGGPARYFLRPAALEGYADVLRRARQAGLPLRVLGGGTNLVVDDAPFPGVVLWARGGSIADCSFDGDRIRVGAGFPLQRLVRRGVQEGYLGIEALTGIPGTVGGALLMNAGGRYGEIGPYVKWVRIVGKDGAERVLKACEIGFRYRSSSLQGFLVLEAELSLPRGVSGERMDLLAERTREKRNSQPTRSPNAGCIFKNPRGGPAAGKLIDDAGLKGAVLGGAEVSRLHANFICARGPASAGDIFRLIDLVRDRVRRASGVELELEVELWRGGVSSAAFQGPS